MKCHALAVVAAALCLAEGNRLKTGRPPSPWAAAEGTGPVVQGMWKDEARPGRRSTGNSTQSQDCSPKCLWKCLGEASCQEVCEPVCAPPQCQTSCRPINGGQCVQKCESPRCAVICPESHCEGGKNCGQCKTVCGEPVCHVQCQQDCQTNCANPVCDWKCKPTAQCPQPKCELHCGAPPDCTAGAAKGDAEGASALATKALQVPVGAVVVSRGLASLDPKAFEAAAAAPAAAPVMSPATA
mmetsp:Transcript_57278/g.133969  ORF Transcript_57278/g.133969 Transcript_57278/m.133969 type:complete len:241 (+) Transcript_57278:39-761(+)